MYFLFILSAGSHPIKKIMIILKNVNKISTNEKIDEEDNESIDDILDDLD